MWQRSIGEITTQSNKRQFLHINCAPVGIRTPNLLIRSQMLYPLSYGRNGEKAILSCRRAHITRE